MSTQSWEEIFAALNTPGPTVSNTALQTSILNPNVMVLFQPQFWKLGRILRIYGVAALSNIATAPGTITIDVTFSEGLIWTSGAQQLSTTAHTNAPIEFEIDLTLFADGSSANFMGQGWSKGFPIIMTSTTDAATTSHFVPLPQTAPAVGTNFNATAAQSLDMHVTFGTANTGNNFTLQQLEVEVPN